MNKHKQEYLKNGYLYLKNFFDKKELFAIKKEAERYFLNQFKNKLSNKIKKFDEKYMFDLFDKDFETFTNCGKHIQQGSINLHNLGINKKLIKKLKTIGLDYPSIATRPVLFFNNPKLAKEEHYYKTPPHQDWNSIRGSLDCAVVWVPLIDINESNGPLRVVPKSHKQGSLITGIIGGFGIVEKYNKEDYIDLPMNLGDILIFSSFLVHESGTITDNSIRWSCNFRYNNIDDKDFIKRNYEFSYIYKPKIKQ